MLLVQVVLSWSCLLLYGTYRFLQWTQLLSTWKGIIIFVAGLGLVTGIMHVFIMFSQSERSSSARAARNRVKKGWGTPNSLCVTNYVDTSVMGQFFSVFVLFRNWKRFFLWQELPSPTPSCTCMKTIVDLFLVEHKLVMNLLNFSCR